ncbi:MAG TPA: hypothetical protein VN408_22595 [Actinoplanes sp.]|nr:hypothetical protein [Actinoplanes sp.]
MPFSAWNRTALTAGPVRQPATADTGWAVEALDLDLQRLRGAAPR